jgi:tetratricopeptide (TPR) repeat protein
VSKLVVFRGDAVEHEIHLAGHTVRIGRDGRNDIVLDDKSVTRFHAEVRFEGGAYFIVDLKSRNGVWVNGQRINGKAALTLGVPVTVGAYELALEDDVATGELGELPFASRTVVNGGSADPPNRPASRSATRRWSTESPATAAKRSALIWSGLVLSTLLVCGTTYVAVRYVARPPSVTETALNPPTAPPPPASQPVPVVDPIKEATDRHLADARTAMEAHDYVAALRDHVTPLLDLDPDNQEALDLKRQAVQAIAAAKPANIADTKADAPAPVVETPGIPRKTGEAPADYIARATRMQANLQEGHRSLEKQDFANAISRFQMVERDDKDYRDIGTLIKETAARQRQAVERAIESGQQNERAGKLADAVRWYQQALRLDSTATSANDRIAALSDRLIKEGLDAFTKAEVFRKRHDDAKAIELYKQAVDLLPSGHAKSREAQEWLEKMKP